MPWSGHPAVQTFYAIVERLNGPDSALESNDCAFAAPEPDPDAPPDQRFGCSGRVMVLFRDLPRNRSAAAWDTLTTALHRALAEEDPTFELGVVGTAPVSVHFRGLPAPTQDGHQLMVAFWAWGATERGCLDNLARLMTNLAGALRVAEGR